MDASRERSRTRWAAIGASVAITLGAGGLGITNATIGAGERNVFVAITPCRLIDTRPAPDTVGSRTSPLGPGETITVQVTGTNGNCIVPTDATAVAANVVAVGPSAAGFFTLFPSNVEKPLSANLNFVAGAPPTPNKVDVKLSPDGKLNVFNFAGSTHLVLDVFGYYADHNHDDRYQAAGDYVGHGPIVVRHGTMGWEGLGGPADLVTFVDTTRVDDDATILLNLPGPLTVGNRGYRLVSVTWCLAFNSSGDTYVTSAWLAGSSGVNQLTATDRAAKGCYTLTAGAVIQAEKSVKLELSIVRPTTGSVYLGDITSMWEPVP